VKDENGQAAVEEHHCCWIVWSNRAGENIALSYLICLSLQRLVFVQLVWKKHILRFVNRIGWYVIRRKTRSSYGPLLILMSTGAQNFL